MNKRQYQAVIFDLDGTLLDTLDDLAAACNQALQEHGFQTIETDYYKKLVGYGARNLVQSAVQMTKPELTMDQIEPVYQTYRRLYAQGWHDKTVIYPGIMDLLQRLQTAGIGLAVLSNKPNDSTQDMIDHYFPSGLFASCYGQLEPYPTKPDPTLALLVAAEMGVEPSAIALVGDSGSDMKTAVNAGMVGIGALWGFREAPELLENGAAELALNAEVLDQLLLT